MVYEKIVFPYCKSHYVVKNGTQKNGKQRLLCKNLECKHKTFQMEYQNNASRPGTKKKIERGHLTLRTRIKQLCRKTICFFKIRNL